MSLLREIQDAAVDSSADILTVLRKCRVLASRLNHDELKSWVQFELDGYPDGYTLPLYRVIEVESKGHFVGPFGTQVSNIPIPNICIPEQYRNMLSHIEFRDSIPALIELAKGKEGVSLGSEWPANAYALFGTKIMQEKALVSAWRQFTTAEVVAIIETVRNRVLNFALEIETANPDAGDAKPGTNPLPDKTVSQIFNTYITGNVGNLASGGTQFHQTATVQIAAGNAKQLREAVKALGLSDDEASELETAIQNDPPMEPGKSFGKNVGAWMGKALGKAAQGALKVSTEIAVETLSRTIRGYCGLPLPP